MKILLLSLFIGMTALAQTPARYPSEIGDARLTELGQKVYRCGTAYTNGTPQITLSGWTTNRICSLIPRKMENGDWYLTWMAQVTKDSGTATGDISPAINGIDIEVDSSAASLYCPFHASAADAGVSSVGITYTIARDATFTMRPNFSHDTSATGVDTLRWSGTCRLAAKPTWAD